MIKSERGITIAALTVYILIFTILIGVMTTISTFFFTNVGKVVDTPKYLSEFNKFSMFFVVDIKNYSKATITDNTVSFENGPTYKYQNGYIYRDDTPICKYIMNCKFIEKQYNVNSVTKTIINVDLQIGKNENKSVKKNIDFTLRYW